ncbi:1-acyl-sn-glycerol-3-phosphate acyltransferase [Candidatus Hydrogenisulfobacillus filiaventi]|uniref:1-acyl-sn-glycerol-3-phosphate acyltransferase n=1 Tax=Candidatus Hydrogenisulfobacillus filiaventi TaxID=2707344 RepID=A0A6F8ZG87_9FIRM|nr:lysophospholipid acyltransferase family protein [Bacillota bacterium]CAB1128717.1 1-acyl-sn-glycerol-3-phosphate acyltransferase [Candidatus Hydrogenisulfobacillus filiaventi]
MFYSTMYWIVRTIFSLWFRLDVEGMERLPRRGPLIVVANHQSAWDPPVMGAVVTRQLWYMAKAELFEYRGLACLIRSLHAFPVRRGTPDRRAIRFALGVLAAGGALLIFPEGHRSRDGELQPARPGTVWLAKKSGAPLVPVGIYGRYGWARRIRFRVGEPFFIPPDMDDQAAQVLIMDRIRELVEAGRREALAAGGRGSS